jgi:2-polyprenyl-3-methyl-5-hydroxy-6-metoxy-1,4-benzoquinol methylase
LGKEVRLVDVFEQFKAVQREGWTKFAPMENITTIPAGRLVSFAQVHAGQNVLDVGCGTGVAAVTAARLGAQVTGSDLTPELLERAKENGEIGGFAIDWREADVENLPFKDGEFDVVVSQFGHMFAPRPSVAIAEMLRVLKPGGTIAFSTWPSDLCMGRMFTLIGSYLPPPAPGVSPPSQWGDPAIVRERLGTAVREVVFDIDTILGPALSPRHFRTRVEGGVGPAIKLVAKLTVEDPAKLAKFREEFERLIGEYFAQNGVRQTYLMTRAVKN